jgi:hypothetical protein
MSAENILLIAFVIWIISVINLLFVIKIQKVGKSELLNKRTLLLALFVALSVVSVSIIISKL